MVISISQTADDDGVMTTISDGRNTTDERSSARLLHFVRCFRLTYEIDVCILVVDLGKKRGGLLLQVSCTRGTLRSYRRRPARFCGTLGSLDHLTHTPNSWKHLAFRVPSEAQLSAQKARKYACSAKGCL